MLAGELFRNHSPLKDGSRIILNFLKMKKLFFLLTVLVLIFIVGCNKNSDLQLEKDLTNVDQKLEQTLVQSNIENFSYTKNTELNNLNNKDALEERDEINAGYYHNKIARKIMPLYQNVQYDFDQIYNSVQIEGLKEGMVFTTSNINMMIIDDLIQSTSTNNDSLNQINFLQILTSTLNQMQNKSLINSNLKNHFNTFILNIYNSNYPNYNENLAIAYQLCQNDIEESIVKNTFSIANYSHDLWTVPENEPGDAHGIIVNDIVGGFIGGLVWGIKKAYNGDYDVSDDDLKDLAVNMIEGAVTSSIGAGFLKFAKYMSK